MKLTKKELYQYVASTKLRNYQKKILDWGMYIFPIMMILPMLVNNIIVFIATVISYVFFINRSKTELDLYAKNLYEFGIYVLYLSWIFAFDIVSSYKNTMFFVIMLPVCLVSYELFFFIGVKSQRRKNPPDKRGLLIWGTVSGGVCGGLSFGRILSRNITFENGFVAFIVLFLQLALFVLGIDLIQKYVIYKKCKSTTKTSSRSNDIDRYSNRT